ncbi:DUF2946 domain-containing protein [Rhodoferax lacus]|uniref:DUF2946 domain-containing protein n=1 Tax=Rhodoferax lacus TaxID=2184758 RepID=A0A3E1R714_9BURK|nr:DUF2946 family protein [Rhodoferax lacus]RFO95158.1 DUF2946 domain-containing protein [Rhodoferax lacus]
MQTLRNAKLIARFVLVWFALSIGVAIASPMVNPQGMQLVCSGSTAMKIVVTDDNGQATTSSHTLECPLCASISAPPPMEIVAFGSAAPVAFAAPLYGASDIPLTLTAPPPARGPPARS